ncbi:MAG: hypothetical protein WA758_07040, partial [Candidatus Acidiferrales bacterium]
CGLAIQESAMDVLVLPTSKPPSLLLVAIWSACHPYRAGFSRSPTLPDFLMLPFAASRNSQVLRSE